MVIFALLLIISGVRAYEIFGFIFKPNVIQKSVVLVPTGSTFNDINEMIIEQNILENPKAFKWVARKKKYKENVKPGRYVFEKGWNTNQVVNVLRIGEQQPVKVTFNNVRTLESLAGKVSAYFELDSLAFTSVLKDPATAEKYGFTAATFPGMFLPNTYEFYWNTSPEKFTERMFNEYEKFWNQTRIEKAAKHNLTKEEAITLASIVQEETIKEEEKPTVAGLYLNRLKRGMLLQADPTIKFAIGDFTVRRITNDMLEVDSPYNTYKNAGLPPGPITIPEISSIESVLNAKDHNYLYMCAREDFSGYHNFARTLVQHNINAAKYRRTLNKNKIYR